MTLEQAERLEEVRAMTPALPDRSSAVRRLIDSLSDDDLTPADAAEGKEDSLSSEDVAAILDALDKRTRAYSELSKQVRHVGHFLNTLTKLAHQTATYGKAGAIPAAAIDSASREITSTLDQMTAIAQQDAHVEAVLRACRS
jgi:hypothetical protein